MDTLSEQVRARLQHEGPTPEGIAAFRTLMYAHYVRHGRRFPWRETDDPYRILVSEVMLQQTSTSRVLKKYQDFISAFPDFQTLADAPLQHVLEAWQGLGYNRRALALHQTARTVVRDYGGTLPSSRSTLLTLPGIGSYTASAIAALAFNQPAAFIETNVRTVFLWFFFSRDDEVPDRDILPLVERTLDRRNPRKWYYALFDYGAMLKKVRVVSARSAHHRRQAPFRGSDREVRGQVLRLLLSHPVLSEDHLIQHLGQSRSRVRAILRQMQKEGFLETSGGTVRIRQGSG